MADNTTLNPGSGGDTVRDKDRAGVKTQIVALDLNPAGGSETLMSGKMPSTVADGDSTTLGALADVKVTGDNTGSLSAKLRGLLYEVGDQADAASLTGSIAAKIRQLGVLLNGGLPAALATGGGLKTDMTTIVGTAPSTSSGNKDAGTLRVTLATDQVALTNALKVDASAGTLPALAAGTALIGKVGAFPGITQVIDSTGVARSVSSTFANVAASSTDSSIVAVSGSTVVYVLAVVCVAGATATNLTFNSKPAGAGSAISPLFANAANGGVVLPFCGAPWFQSSASQGLTVTTGAGSTTGILVLYAQF